MRLYRIGNGEEIRTRLYKMKARRRINISWLVEACRRSCFSNNFQPIFKLIRTVRAKAVPCHTWRSDCCIADWWSPSFFSHESCRPLDKRRSVSAWADWTARSDACTGAARRGTTVGTSKYNTITLEGQRSGRWGKLISWAVSSRKSRLGNSRKLNIFVGDGPSSFMPVFRAVGTFIWRLIRVDKTSDHLD